MRRAVGTNRAQLGEEQSLAAVCLCLAQSVSEDRHGGRSAGVVPLAAWCDSLDARTRTNPGRRGAGGCRRADSDQLSTDRSASRPAASDGFGFARRASDVSGVRNPHHWSDRSTGLSRHSNHHITISVTALPALDAAATRRPPAARFLNNPLPTF